MTTETPKTHKFQCRISTARVANVAGVSRQSFHAWRNQYIYEPLRRAGLPVPEHVCLQSCWAVAIAKGMQRDGMSPEACQKVSEFLDGLSPDAIEKSFSEGRTYVVVASDEVFHNLLPMEAIKSDYVKEALLRAVDAGKPLTLRAIDTRPLLLQLAELGKDDEDVCPRR